MSDDIDQAGDSLDFVDRFAAKGEIGFVSQRRVTASSPSGGAKSGFRDDLARVEAASETADGFVSRVGMMATFFLRKVYFKHHSMERKDTDCNARERRLQPRRKSCVAFAQGSQPRRPRRSSP
ncbi:MAG TPA: hypothetical protein VMI72_14520 [Roseiarcus sp.]|nr:hypothetical protein [Roseiarcus sp.]